MTGRIPEEMAGTWIEGHWRWMSSYLLVEKAWEWGFPTTEAEDRLVAAYRLGTDIDGACEFLLQERGERGWPSESMLQCEASDLLKKAAKAMHGPGGLVERAVAHLNYVAPEGMAFEWGDGLHLKCKCQIKGTVEADILYEDGKRRCARCEERDGA